MNKIFLGALLLMVGSGLFGFSVAAEWSNVNVPFYVYLLSLLCSFVGLSLVINAWLDNIPDPRETPFLTPGNSRQKPFRPCKTPPGTTQ